MKGEKKKKKTHETYSENSRTNKTNENQKHQNESAPINIKSKGEFLTSTFVWILMMSYLKMDYKFFLKLQGRDTLKSPYFNPKFPYNIWLKRSLILLSSHPFSCMVWPEVQL